MIDVLKRPQSCGVWRRYVHRNVVGNGEHRAQTKDIVVDGTIERCDGVFSNVHADHTGRPPRAEACDDSLGAVVGESHPVDDAVVLWQPKNAWQGVPRLGLRGHGTDLNMTEAESEPPVHRDAVLVEAGR